MPGLVPGIHVFPHWIPKDMDGRDKPGHDDNSEPSRKKNSSTGIELSADVSTKRGRQTRTCTRTLRSFGNRWLMSAYPEADIDQTIADVSFVPEADVMGLLIASG
jgi:hypothetical protein